MKSYMIVLISFAAAIMASCSQDFLKEELLTQDSSENQYSIEAGLERLIVGCYATLKIWYGQEYGWDFTSAGTDIYDHGQQHPQQYQFAFTSDFNPTNSRLVVQWVELYKGINACNDAISVMEGKRELIPNPFDKTHSTLRLAEVKYLRALYNYLIVETWGGKAVLRTEPIESALASAKNSTLEAFYEIIEFDLDDAVANLSATDNTGSSEFGRITKVAALGLRARVSLTQAWHFNDNSYLRKAKNDADAVISMKGGESSLWDRYADLWKLENNDNNPETVWAVNYSRTTYAEIGVPASEYWQYQQDGDKPWSDRDGGHHGHLRFGIQYDVMPGMVRDMENGRPFRRYFPTKYLIDAFNADLDERFYDSFKTTWFANHPTDRFNVNKSASINTDTGLIYIYTVRYTNATGQTVLYDSLVYNSNTGSGRFMVGPKYIRSDIDNLHKYPKVGKEGKLLFEQGDTAIHFIKGEFDDANQLVNVSSGYFFHDTNNYWCLDRSNMYNQDGTINDVQTNNRNIGFELHKFYDNERDAANGAGSMRGIRDSYVIRLSEMYLISAEAAWKSGDVGAAHQKLLTLANKRAKEGVTGAQLLASYGIRSGGDLTLEFFLDERAREFAGEQMRWFDLRRTGTFVERMKKYAGNQMARSNVDAHFAVRPIPQAQIDFIENKDEFSQNPGY